MKFRSRLLLALIPATVIPVAALALLVRAELTVLLRNNYEDRAEALVHAVRTELAQQAAFVRRALAATSSSAADDGRLRRAMLDHDPTERGYLLDYGARAMAMTGLSVLRIQDGEGRILSSGHFRNEYDRVDPGLPAKISELGLPANGLALTSVRSPDAPLLAIVRTEPLRMAGRDFRLLGGHIVDSEFLGRLAGPYGVQVSLHYNGEIVRTGIVSGEASDPEIAAGMPPGSAETSASERSDSPGGDEIVRAIAIPYVTGDGTVGQGEVRITIDLRELRVVQATVDRWLIVVSVAAIVLMALLVTWLSAGVSRPLLELADKTSRLDLDRLNVAFKADRKDEIGSMSRTLGALAGRLRASRATIRDAERRATLGELARQVNHDIRNGLAPIRNVLRHFSQVASEHPSELPRVFQERRETLDASVRYLEELASNYARLSPRTVHQLCNVNDVVRQVAADAHVAGTPAVQTSLKAGSRVRADPVALRRVLENLVDNALRSIDAETGSVMVATEGVSDRSGASRVRITVRDTGAGMSETELTQAFDDFYTTREGGTGLGLSIVRRLVTDLGGTIRLESEKGEGTLVTIDMPSAADPAH